MSWLSGAFFTVSLSGKEKGKQIRLEGAFTSVSGLAMEVSYYQFLEGGSRFPRYFIEEVRPQVLVLEQGIITEENRDQLSELMSLCSAGAAFPMSGSVTLKNRKSEDQRVWEIQDAYLQKYIGPDLNSSQASLAVTRMEFLYNGTL